MTSIGRYAELVGPAARDLEDAVGGKVAILVSRVEPRDYADIVAALDRYSPAQLISFARRLDPGLTGEDFADARQELDHIDDRAFAEAGLSQQQVTALRERFAAWPRHARTATQEPGPRDEPPPKSNTTTRRPSPNRPAPPPMTTTKARKHPSIELGPP